MEHFYLPVKALSMNEDHVDRFRERIEELPAPVFLHCAPGKRSGAFTMMHLALPQGWSGERVICMAGKMGFECDTPQLGSFVRTHVASSRVWTDGAAGRMRPMLRGPPRVVRALSSAPAMSGLRRTESLRRDRAADAPQSGRGLSGRGPPGGGLARPGLQLNAVGLGRLSAASWPRCRGNAQPKATRFIVTAGAPWCAMRD